MSRGLGDVYKRQGCDCYQGYYVSEPLEMGAISDWLDNGRMARQVN